MEPKNMTKTLLTHPFTEGTVVLNEATQVVAKAKEREVRDVQSEMKSTVALAASLLKEMQALQDEHGPALDELARVDINLLRAYPAIPERLLMAFHRNLADAQGLLASTLHGLPKISQRVKDLDLSDIHARREQGIRDEVKWMSEAPAAFRSKLALVDRYLREIQSCLGRNGGALRESLQVRLLPERTPRQTKAVDGLEP